MKCVTKSRYYVTIPLLLKIVATRLLLENNYDSTDQVPKHGGWC